MKYICSILVLYLLALIVYPCQDCGDHDNKQGTEHHEKNCNDKDGCHKCSPFCVCSCCQGNTLPVLKVILEKSAAVFTPVATFYREVSLKEVLIDIWEPPKI